MSQDKKIVEASDEELKAELQRREDEKQKVHKERHYARMHKIIDLGMPGVDAYVSEHGRTSCSDDNTQNGWGSTSNGSIAPRCVRCALIELVKNHEIPPSDVSITISIECPGRG